MHLKNKRQGSQFNLPAHKTFELKLNKYPSAKLWNELLPNVNHEGKYIYLFSFCLMPHQQIRVILGHAG